MVRLNVIYTRTGDHGETGLGDGARRSKADARVAAMGDVDETNCAIGLALLAVRSASDAADLAIEPMLTRVQNDLFDLGADLCLPKTTPRGAGRSAPDGALSSRIARACDRRPERETSPVALVRAAGRLGGLRRLAPGARSLPTSRAQHGGAVVNRGRASRRGVARLREWAIRLSFRRGARGQRLRPVRLLWTPGANQSDSRDPTEDDEQ